MVWPENCTLIKVEVIKGGKASNAGGRKNERRGKDETDIGCRG
jgi:hypothetical protein